MTEIGAFHGFVDRGDPSAHDFTKNNLQLDGGIHELDLSGIIPPNTRGVLAKISINSPSASDKVWIRKKGNTNYINLVGCVTQIGGLDIDYTIIVSVSADRKIEYFGANVAWNSVYLNIRGWWI